MRNVVVVTALLAVLLLVLIGLSYAFMEFDAAKYFGVGEMNDKSEDTLGVLLHSDRRSDSKVVVFVVDYFMSDHGRKVAHILNRSSMFKCQIRGVGIDSPSKRATRYLDCLADIAEYSKENPDKRIIVNISLGSSAADPDEMSLVESMVERGITIVAAAGNYRNGNRRWPFPECYPAAFDDVIAVGAVTRDGRRAEYSYEGRYVDISAVADAIRIESGKAQHRGIAKHTEDRWLIIGGTSRAAPQISGLLAYLMRQNPGMSSAKAFSIIKETGIPLEDSDLGGVRVNPSRALYRADALYRRLYLAKIMCVALSCLFVVIRPGAGLPALVVIACIHPVIMARNGLIGGNLLYSVIAVAVTSGTIGLYDLLSGGEESAEESVENGVEKGVKKGVKKGAKKGVKDEPHEGALWRAPSPMPPLPPCITPEALHYRAQTVLDPIRDIERELESLRILTKGKLLETLMTVTKEEIDDERWQRDSLTREIALGVPAEMVLIPGGSFEMGNCMDPDEGREDELPAHMVDVNAFHVDKYEVTNDKMAQVLNWAYGRRRLIVDSSSVRIANGHQWVVLDLSKEECRITWDAGSEIFGMKPVKGTGYPCVEVTWYGAVAYCNYRSQKEGRTPCYDLSDWSCNWSANGYRLPTEAQWEKAARGGVAGHRFPWSDSDEIQHARANYTSDGVFSYDTGPTRGHHPDYDEWGEPYTSPVGALAPNGYGLYDMCGNVAEWCWDWWDKMYYSSPQGMDPRGPAPTGLRAFRAGSWNDCAVGCRVARRDQGASGWASGDLGFRTVLPATQE
ncbi:SUMF1/EgtB/PvdO family nonheme iron enzyme [Verrucomicrobiota bacterium]